MPGSSHRASHRIVEERAVRAAIPSPRVYLIPQMQPNAFATGRNPEHAVVAVTSGIRQPLLALVAPIAATLIQLGISRSREYAADRTGAETSGDSEALARALEKLEQEAHAVPTSMQPAAVRLFIVNPFSGTESVLNLLSTHASMRERIRRLPAMQGNAGGWPVRTRDATLDAGW